MKAPIDFVCIYIIVLQIIYYGGMNMDDDDILDEDTTKYGEFISSYFVWIPISKQKKRAEELQDMTKDKI